MSELNLRPAAANELFVIDGALPDIQTLINAIGPNKWVVVLDPSQDGVSQLADLLRDESWLDAVHVFSHGSAGSLTLGTAVLDQSSLGSYSNALESIGSSLSETGDLLLYGCDVAQGDIGQAFIDHLAAFTGADVAASVDATGSETLGGNWLLETRVGVVDVMPVCLPDSAFQSLLATGIHWDQPLMVEGMPFTIPAYGDYGGPDWTAGVLRGTVIVGPEQLDDLDQVFKVHDGAFADAQMVFDNSDMSEQAWQTLVAARAAAHSNAIIAMTGLTYEAGTDMEAYAGATTLAFLGQLAVWGFPFPNTAVAALFALTRLKDSTVAFEATDSADFARKLGFIKFVYSAAAACGLENPVELALLSDILRTVFDTVVALDAMSAVGEVALDILSAAVQSGADAIASVANAAAKALLAAGATAFEIAALGTKLVAAGVIDLVEFLYAVARDVVDAGIAVSDVISGGDLFHTLRDGIAAFDLTDEIGQLFVDADVNVTGNSLDNTIIGNNGDNILNGLGGNDSIDAGSGDDVIDAGRGGAFVDGGAGQDRLTLDLSDATGPLNYSFADASGTGHGPYGMFSSLESLQSGLAAANSLYGFYIYSFGSTVFYRNVEAVNLTTGSGDDLLIYQGGTRYDGGAGTDAFYADFSATTQAMNWDADANSFTPVDGVTVSNIERFLIRSGSGDDLFRATQGGLSHHIDTGAGNDTVELGAGNDDVTTGDGNDTVDTGAGNDNIDAGSGDDLIDAGRGGAFVDGGAGQDRLTLDLSDVTGSLRYSFALDSIGNGGFDRGAASSFQDLQVALAGANASYGFYIFGPTTVFYRNVEAVNLTTGSGDDLLIYQGGTHHDGGAGTDAFYADWSSATNAIAWDNDLASSQTSSGITITGIDRLLVATGIGDDVISNITSGANNEIHGGAGNDRLSTGAGNDVLHGGDGNDTLTGGQGNNSIIGGLGSDVIVLDRAGLARVSDFVAGTGGDVLSVDGLLAFASGLGAYSGGDPFAGPNAVLRLAQVGADAEVQFDADGMGGSFGWTAVASLQGVAAASLVSSNFTGASNSVPTGTASVILSAGTEDTSYLISAASLLQGFSDADGDTLSVAGLTADHGSVVDNANGTWTFTPAANYNGLVSLTYSVIDGNGGSVAATQSFGLAAINDAPTGSATAVLPAGTEDSAYIVSNATLLAVFSDVDGDTLSVSSLASDHGSVADNGNGTWTVTPAANYDGPVSLTYNVIDGNGGSVAATQDFNLAAVNDAPKLAQALTNSTVALGQAFQYLVPTSTFTDIDAGDALTLSASLAGGTALPAWMTFDPNTGTFAGVPGAGDVGTLTVRLTATDLAGATTFGDFNVVVNSQNDPPVAVSDSATPLRNTSIVVPVRANDSDPNGDALTVVGITQGALGAVAIDAVTGSPTYTPDLNFVGDDAFSYTVSDGHGGQATATVAVLVASQLGDSSANSLAGTNGADVIAGLGGADVISAGAGNDLVDGGDGDDTLRGGTGATDQLRGGAGNDVIQVAGNELTGDVIDGGAGSDTLTFLGNVTLGAAGFTMVGVETLDMGGFNLAVQGTTPLDLSALALANSGAINGNAADNAIIGTQGNDTLNGGAGADALAGSAGDDTLRGGAGEDTLNGGADNDTFQVAGTELTGDTIDGGTGSDTLRFLGNITLGAVNFSLTGVETLDMAGFNLAIQTTTAVDLSGLALVNGGAVNGNASDNVITGTQAGDAINGGGGSDLLAGAGGDDVLRGGSGADTIDGGAGSDVVLVTGGELTGDVIDGGADADTLQFLGNVTLGLAGFTMQGVETLDMAGFSMTVQATTKVDLSALSLLNGGSINGDGGNNIIVGTHDADSINGGTGNDVLYGSGGDDAIAGGSGSDVIAGGAGNDALTGGTGSDTFIFDTAFSTTTNVDSINGFAANAADRIALDPALFAALLGGTTAGVDSDEFRAGAGGNAADANDFILFDSATGSLYYDADGNGAGSKVLFAVLSGVTGTLDYSDFTTNLPPAP